MSARGKHLDFEVNLIPFIDLLSTCICFLLLTAVWLQIAAMDVKQAVGGQAGADAVKRPTVWAHLDASGGARLELQNPPGARDGQAVVGAIAGHDGKPDLDALASWIDQARSLAPELSVALVHPDKATPYEDVIALMDEFRRLGLQDLGVAPL